MFGFSLATASTVVLLRAMEERRLLDTRRGKIAVGWLIVEDLACVIALVLIPALAGALGGSEAVGIGGILKALAITSVSYTHLDVYKRQVSTWWALGTCRWPPAVLT